MRERAENELLPLQEIRKVLPTDEALAVLPGVTDINYHNNDRLLLYDSDDPEFQINQLENIQSTGRILVWSSDIQLLNNERKNSIIDSTITKLRH
ncbi:unnamed protein product, partial [Rotaria sp. Silwood2]